MRTHHVFSRAREDTKGKETEITKEVVANVCDNLEEVSRHQPTQGPLKQTTHATE